MLKIKVMLNPFSIFFIIVLGTLCIYSFGWSQLNPELSGSMLLFLGFILVSSLVFSYLYNIYFPEGTFLKNRFKINLIPWTIIGIISMLAEFIYEKAIPIVEILIFKSGYYYVDFEGIPVFHVFVVTFTSFLGLYYWSLFVKEGKLSLFFFSLLFVSYPILLFNRGGFLMNLVSMFFVFLYQKKSVVIKLKHVFVFFCVIFVFLYVFGLFGNIRSDSEHASKDITNSSFILRVGEATKGFEESIIPKPYFWGYIYATTPLANLQNMTEKIHPSYDGTLFLTQTVLPDFIGKRVEEKLNRTVQKDKRVAPVFNVSTMFVSAFKTFGFLGMFLNYFYFAFFIFAYSLLMKRLNTCSEVGIAILLTITVFSLFDNMLVFSGLSFQLIYPIVFWIYKKI